MEFAKKIIDSTEEIFNTMIFMDISPGSALQGEKLVIPCHASAMIGLSGDFSGMLGMHCPQPVALSIAGAMLGMDLEKIDADVKDALGEIVNMLAGGLKQAFAQENVGLELAIPTAVAGKSYTISSPSGSDRVIVPFDIEQGQFFVEMKYRLS